MRGALRAAWIALLAVAGGASAAPVATGPLLQALTSPILLQGDGHTAYRDPLLAYAGGRFHLFYSYVREEEDHLIYWYTAESTSTDLRHWSEPRALTPKDQNLNYSSPGSLTRVGDEWLLTLQTYPIVNFRRGDKLRFGDDRARIFLMRSRDLEHWGVPELIRVKGPDVSEAAMGKMIDPFLLRDKDVPAKWWCFYKQAGNLHSSWSMDLKTWSPGAIGLAHGENPCVIVQGGEYVLFYAPKNGVGVKRSADLMHWRDDGAPLVFGQANWPWTETRLTAGYVADLRSVPGVGAYVMVFHGSSPGLKPSDNNENAHCSLGIAWSQDLKHWTWPGSSLGLPDTAAFRQNAAEADAAMQAGNAAEQGQALAYPKGNGLRILMTGHSWVAPGKITLPLIAKAAGYTGHVQRDHSSGGANGSARAIWRNEHGDDKTKPQRVLLLPAIATGKWDVMTWGMYFNDSPQDYENWIDLCLKGNPAMVFYIQDGWPAPRISDEDIPQDRMLPMLEKMYATTMTGLFRHNYEVLEAKYPGKVHIIPAGAAVVLMLRHYFAGELPGFDCMAETGGGKRGIYRSDSFHLSTTSGIGYLVGYCYYGELYRRSPELIKDFHPAGVDPTVDHLMRQAAWQAIVHSPYSGITDKDGDGIADAN